MELHVRMVACIALSAIGAQGEVAVNVVQWGSRVIVKGAMELGLLVSLNLLSVITRSHHNDITHTNAFHDLVFDTVNSSSPTESEDVRSTNLPTSNNDTFTSAARSAWWWAAKANAQPLLVVAGTEASSRHF